jgi:hypothetical protein
MVSVRGTPTDLEHFNYSLPGRSENNIKNYKKIRGAKWLRKKCYVTFWQGLQFPARLCNLSRGYCKHPREEYVDIIGVQQGFSNVRASVETDILLLFFRENFRENKLFLASACA